MIVLAIDGASRRNGKPDCLAAGAVFVRDTETGSCMLQSRVEYNATNQRGEIAALLKALEYGCDSHEDVFLVTDSEYVFNTVSKTWYKNWRNKGWVTGVGDPVKNRDMWETAGNWLDNIEDNGHDVTPYHVKGHLLSIGKATAEKALAYDKTGMSLYALAANKWDDFMYDVQQRRDPKAVEKYNHAVELFERNHGFPPTDSFRELIICNTVADYAAGYITDWYDARWKR